LNLFDFETISQRAQTDPKRFMDLCDENYAREIRRCAQRVADGIHKTPILLLTGPSGSGKTTSAKRVELELKRLGVRTHVISMDNYFRTVSPDSHPRDENGNIDFESPECMDLPLLGEHLEALAGYHKIWVPKFDFANQRRYPDRTIPLHMRPGEVAVVEGIHAFNPSLTGMLGGRALKLYVSARSGITKGGEPFFPGTWTRLTRRLIRDRNFRGSSAEQTLRMWASVRRGEKLYISPYKDSADMVIDTAHPYELCVMRRSALPLLERIPEDCERAGEWKQLYPRLLELPAIPEKLVERDALLREFIGGGSIRY
jgi:uridine kinase